LRAVNSKIILNYHHYSAEIFLYYIIHVSTTDEFMWFHSVLPAISSSSSYSTTAL